MQDPVFLNRQDFVNVSPGVNTVPSGTVSLTNAAWSHAFVEAILVSVGGIRVSVAGVSEGMIGVSVFVTLFASGVTTAADTVKAACVLISFALSVGIIVRCKLQDIIVRAIIEPAINMLLFFRMFLLSIAINLFYM